MIQVKRLLTAAALAGAFGLSFLTTSSFANGPMILGPSPAPITVPRVFVSPSVQVVPIQTKLLNSYRQLRAFWLSRAIVR